MKSLKKNIVIRTFLLYRKFWKPFTVVLVFSLLAQIITAFSPFIQGKTMDALLVKQFVLAAKYIGVVFLLNATSDILLGWIRGKYEIQKIDNETDRYISIFSLKKLFKFSIGQHTNEHSGIKLSTVNRGKNSLFSFIDQTLYQILPNALQILVSLGALLIFDFRIGIIALFFVSFYIWISHKRNRKAFASILELRTKRQGQSKTENEIYRNISLVISESQEQKTADEFHEVFEANDSHQKFFWSRYYNIFYTHRTIMYLGQYFCIGLGLYLITLGLHTPGSFIALVGWIGGVFGNIQMIMNIMRNMMFQMADIKKYFDLIDTTPAIDPNIDGRKIDPLIGTIEFRNVSFAYPSRRSSLDEEKESFDEEKNEDHAIENISFLIEAGSKVGFVGKSGSGKSTIISLIKRYYDTASGEILIDGVPLHEIDLSWLRKNIGNVEQKVDLFDRSVKDNIMFSLEKEDTDTGNSKLTEVIEDSSLEEFVSKLKEHGLETLIGEGGIKVSGGERQRIGIARALIKNPKILILDEATSSLDAHNEKLIHDAINKSAVGRTTIIVAHRLSTVRDADKIFVVDEGKIIAEGKHEKLIDSCPEYANLVKNQVF